MVVQLSQTNNTRSPHPGLSWKEKIKFVLDERIRGVLYPEESCDIETAALFLKSNERASIETYLNINPFKGMMFM
jgi:hypothetical protein